MTVFPNRFLAMLAFFILLSKPLQADWPKVLVLPPECENRTSREVGKAFQWNLVDVFYKYKYFEVVMQKEYEEYLQAHGMAGAEAIPDSVLPQMIADLRALIYLRSTISQPAGVGTELSAQVTYVFPKQITYFFQDKHMKDDYVINSGQLTVPNEKQWWKLALKCLKVAIDHRKQIKILKEARHAYNSGVYPYPTEKDHSTLRLQRALKRFQELEKMEPQNVGITYMVAMCYMKMNRHAEAVAKLNEILTSIDPDHVPTHETLANHYFSTNDFEGALRHFSKLVEIDPENYSYLRNKALALTELGRMEEAIADFEKLVGIEDEDAAIRHQMAEYYYDKASELEAAGYSAAAKPQASKALEYMTRGCEISRSAGDPADPAWLTIHCQRLNFLATLQHELKDTGKEIATLQEIVELDPAFPGALYNLGIYAHKAKKFEKAMDYYEKALHYADDAQKAALYNQIGIINFKEFKKYPQAITAFTSALTTNDPYSKELVYYLRGAAYYGYANELDYANDEVADIDALIHSGTMSHARADRALELYAKSLADFQKVSPGNHPKIVRSVQQHTDKITKLQERLTKIKQQIDYNKKTK